MVDVTSRQLAVLRVIEHHRRKKGYPPTVREIGEVLGIASTNGVADHLAALERKKLLTRGEVEARSCIPTAAGRALLNVANWPLDEAGLYDAHLHRNVNASSPLKAFVVLRGISALGEGATASEAIQRATQLWGTQR